MEALHGPENENSVAMEQLRQAISTGVPLDQVPALVDPIIEVPRRRVAFLIPGLHASDDATLGPAHPAHDLGLSR